MAPNEARAKLDLPPVAGGASPYLQQQNYSLAALDKRDSLDDPFKPATPPPPPAGQNTPPAPDARTRETQAMSMEMRGNGLSTLSRESSRLLERAGELLGREGKALLGRLELELRAEHAELMDELKAELARVREIKAVPGPAGPAGQAGQGRQGWRCRPGWVARACRAVMGRRVRPARTAATGMPGEKGARRRAHHRPQGAAQGRMEAGRIQGRRLGYRPTARYGAPTRDTTTKPNTGGKDDWQLIVKCGRDGRDGKDGAPGARGERGPMGTYKGIG